MIADWNLARPWRLAVLSSLFLLAALAGCSKSNQVAEVTGRVVNYGLVKAPVSGAGTNTIASGTNTVASVTHSAPVITVTTNRIPAKLGVSFGMAFEVAGLPAKDGEVVQLAVGVTGPAVTQPDEKVTKGFTYLTKAPVKGGKTWGIPFYTFEHDYELAPGIWQFEVSYAGKRLVQQSFLTYRE